MIKFWRMRNAGPIKAIHPTTGKVIEVDPQRDARVGSDFSKQLQRMPPLISWWMSLRDVAETRYREAKHEEHNAEEDLYEELRAASPKATETTVKMAIKKHPRMRRAFRARMDAQDMVHKLRSAAEVMIHKRFVLDALLKSAMHERTARDSM